MIRVTFHGLDGVIYIEAVGEKVCGGGHGGGRDGRLGPLHRDSVPIMHSLCFYQSVSTELPLPFHQLFHYNTRQEKLHRDSCMLSSVGEAYDYYSLDYVPGMQRGSR